MLLVPFIFIPLVRYGGKEILLLFPEFKEYLPIAIILFGAMVAIFPAFVMGFVMMDEKDGGLNNVLRVLPFDLNKLIWLRVTTIFTLGLFNSITFFWLNGIMEIGFFQILLLSVNVSLFSPINAFIMLCISSNKIEAAAVLKGISFVTLLPLLQFFSTSSYEYFLAPIPTFWVYRAFDMIDSNSYFVTFILIGIVVQFLYLIFLWKIFLKRW
jgi:hypothetical protein